MSDFCRTNLILASDSYKLGHWSQYPEGTETVYSYMEARKGAAHPYTVFFGLQYILKRFMTGRRVTHQDVDDAALVSRTHFGNDHTFNEAGWRHVVDAHRGRLPLRIRAVPEGTVVPTGNVMMTVENTCPECFWLTNAMESMLTHVWYPATVATVSRATLETIGTFLSGTAMSTAGLPFMLHDFGYRGASSHESAGIGGAAHLICGRGTDTLSAMQVARDYYDAELETLAFSVPATEHSVMTALGRDGEMDQVERVLRENPTGIVSIVADSYDIYGFVHAIGARFHDEIMARDGRVVIRPDSLTPEHRTPEREMVWIAEQLWHDFGGEANAKGFRVLDPHVGILWGDGIDPEGIRRIMAEMVLNSFSVECCVFGMGGGLLQKVNRDTERFAFKASAMQRNGVWRDVSKEPLDHSKASKAGRLGLVRGVDGELATVARNDAPGFPDVLRTVFVTGRLINPTTFEQVRERAALDVPDPVLA